jgi:hypothetical protein
MSIVPRVKNCIIRFLRKEHPPSPCSPFAQNHPILSLPITTEPRYTAFDPYSWHAPVQKNQQHFSLVSLSRR